MSSANGEHPSPGPSLIQDMCCRTNSYLTSCCSQRTTFRSRGGSAAKWWVEAMAALQVMGSELPSCWWSISCSHRLLCCMEKYWHQRCVANMSRICRCFFPMKGSYGCNVCFFGGPPCIYPPIHPISKPDGSAPTKVVLRAVQKNGVALQFADVELRADKDWEQIRFHWGVLTGNVSSWQVPVGMLKILQAKKIDTTSKQRPSPPGKNGSFRCGPKSHGKQVGAKIRPNKNRRTHGKRLTAQTEHEHGSCFGWSLIFTDGQLSWNLIIAGIYGGNA